MKKTVLLVTALMFVFLGGYAQTDALWSVTKNKSIVVSESSKRPSFPTEFKLFQLNIEPMKQILAKAQDRFLSKKAVRITLPNAEGQIESFDVFEASNFETALQVQFPEIRSYVGKSLTDATAILRMSLSPQGISTMIFRADKADEFMEPYSEDATIYAVYNASRSKGKLPFICSTEDTALTTSLNNQITSRRSGTLEMLTFRLALSCTGEYGAAAGGTIAAALARMNTTMTRVNGVFEKDLSIHMNIIANNTAIIYTNAATDPYSAGAAGAAGAWNAELQNNLNTVLGNSVYDIGHLFGNSGGGGNAGCIGCVCVDGQKGSGFTSPGSGSATGDNFDIDYVAHEMGHQFGGNHTFSHNVEGAGVNVEPGSGSTIMGYAGITNYDVQAHSSAYFHYASIRQIEQNMLSKTCPVRTPLANAAPIVNAGINYTIPKSTPFILTGNATDANGDALTYCWEQMDTATTETSAASAASATKAEGPNWRSYTPATTPTRYFPPIARVIANASTTTSTAITVEALSSVGRTLNFALTARDNKVGGGLTGTDATLITVNSNAGPFLVSTPNTAVSWVVGSNQTVTWAVAGTTANGINAAYVDIYLSTNGGTAFTTLLASKVPNDGSETITVPNNVGATNRIIIKGYNHVFYDMSNANFTITAATSSFAVGFDGLADGQNKQVCQGINSVYTIPYTAYAGFTGTTTFAVTGLPSGAVGTFLPNTATASGNIMLTISNTNNVTPAVYPLTVTATSGATSKTVPIYLEIFNAGFGTFALNSPADLSEGVATTVPLSWGTSSNANSYEVQIATDNTFTNIVSSVTVTTTNFNATGLLEGTNYFWRVLPKNLGCSGTYSSTYKFTTGQTVCTTYYPTDLPLTISSSGTPTVTSTITIPTGTTIADVNIGMDLSHTRINDLTAIISDPSSNMIYLFANPCTTSSQNINATFDDAALEFVCGANPGISQTVRAIQDLAVFNGNSSAGTWTLQIIDGTNGQGGTLNGWNIQVCGFQALAVTENEFKDFAIFPNPNKGNFTIQFNSNSNNDVNIAVYDLRGRIIFDKKYNNNGLFSQNLQLEAIQSGVYLVSVQDGEKRIVKRIVIE